MMKARIWGFLNTTALAAVLLCPIAVAEEFSPTPEDIAEWRVKAERGDADAQYNLGYAYIQGKSVAQDKKAGRTLVQKAAERGHGDAQFDLYIWYSNGDGVTRNVREAVRWCRKAAEQGVAIAQYYLALAYKHGKGLIADERESYIWHTIASANGYEASYWALKNIKQKIEYGRYVPLFDMRSAKKEAAQRLDAIDRRKAANEKKSSAEYDIATAAKPKGINIAERVFENTWRSVVVVSVSDGQGSGVIVRPNVVATNCHVVDTRGEIKIYKSDDRRADTGTAFSARTRHSDEDKDFCLLDVDGLWGVPATVRKYDTLGIGEDVYGLGAPHGLDLSLSAGVISQLRKID
ncbi:MAG: tetratricopeptide repeat-containing serine protease family protein, partial [Gammaproteobacteria bacterium]|nr:tetratricopeptide repeat-containing serine protease family protein [Gammaproteobacteria bacterium]